MTGFIAPSIKQLISSIERRGLSAEQIMGTRKLERIKGEWRCEMADQSEAKQKAQQLRAQAQFILESSTYADRRMASIMQARDLQDEANRIDPPARHPQQPPPKSPSSPKSPSKKAEAIKRAIEDMAIRAQKLASGAHQ